MIDTLHTLRNELTGLSAEESVRHVFERFGARAALASSLGAEDQVLTHMAWRKDREPRIFVIDTGRLFRETAELIGETEARYGAHFEVFHPDEAAVREMEDRYGRDLFYDSVEKRKLCCETRKLEPLRRALSSLDVWITGLRRGQSVTRAGVESAEWDESNGLIKINPLHDWSEERVWDYIREHGVPCNPLHDRNFPSIGCEPCTRAVSPGDDIRSGRWWWEAPEHKECGLHRRSTGTERQQ